MVKYNSFIKLSEGYSLVELVFAIALISLAILPIFDLLTRSTNTAKISHQKLEATVLAIELVNQICSMRFSEVPVLSEVLLNNDANNALLQAGKPITKLVLSDLPSGFERLLTVNEISEKAKKVKVVVSWKTKTIHKVKMVKVIGWAP